MPLSFGFDQFASSIPSFPYCLWLAYVLCVLVRILLVIPGLTPELGLTCLAVVR